MPESYICLIEQDDGFIKYGKTRTSLTNLQKNKNCKIIFEKCVQDVKTIEPTIVEELEKIAERHGKKKLFKGDKDQIIETVSCVVNRQRSNIYPYINKEMFKFHYPYVIVFDQNKYTFQNREYFQLGKDKFSNDPEIEASNNIIYRDFDNFKNYNNGKVYLYDQHSNPMKCDFLFEEYKDRIKSILDWCKKNKMKEVGIKLVRAKIMSQ
jgi:hypothetical protein